MLFRSFKIDSPTMTTVHAEADVLLNILLMLQRIGTKIESQKQRLEILETTSPTSSHNTTLFETFPLSRRQSMKKAINTETVTAECDELKDQELDTSNIYARSIMKMRLALEDALELVDAEPRLSLVEPAGDDAGDTNSLSDIETRDSEKENHMGEGDDTNVVPGPKQKEADLYSLSAYTEDLLNSRMNIYNHTTTGTWNENSVWMTRFCLPLRNPSHHISIQRQLIRRLLKR